eukprot:TRINITY_DN25933_c0_g1_i1.p1 TRINITY_DN25933_c0_g1~~TRINITY_DN25933_c0_g1_i1.p1  ORF type:complete len:453 (+),score=41.22 TRINITY_DN25933_c0_g1_i1:39-1397(+)
MALCALDTAVSILPATKKLDEGFNEDAYGAVCTGNEFCNVESFVTTVRKTGIDLPIATYASDSDDLTPTSRRTSILRRCTISCSGQRVAPLDSKRSVSYAQSDDVMFYKISRGAGSKQLSGKFAGLGVPRCRSSAYGIQAQSKWEMLSSEFDFTKTENANFIRALIMKDASLDENHEYLRNCHPKVKVYRSKKKRTKWLAVKETVLKRECDVERFENELMILSTVTHPHVVMFRGLFQESPRHYHVLTDFARGGDLLQLINSCVFRNCLSSLSSEVVISMLYQMLSGLVYLHQLSIVHRDIKPQHYVLQNNEFVDTYLTVQLTGFVFACKTMPEDGLMTSQVGTWRYAAPEVIAGKPYSNLCDIWSLGCTVFAVCVGRLPFFAAGIDSLQEQMESETTPDWELPDWKRHKAKLKGVICQMLQKDSNIRPSAVSIMNASPWLNARPRQSCSMQ